MKGNKPNPNNKFEDAFEKFKNQVPKEYFDQFKKTDYAKVDKKVQERDNLRQGNAKAVIKGSSNKQNVQTINVAKALDPESDIKIKEVPKEISVQVQKARQEANLSQDQLAKLVEVKPSAIKDLEAGTGVYDAQLVVKIETKLKKKFDRSWKK